MTSLTKKEYAAELRKWIGHKRKLMVLPGYTSNAKWQVSMGKIWDLYRACMAECDAVNMNALMGLVRINEEHLRNILPMQMNASYESSLKKLEELLTIAKNYK